MANLKYIYQIAVFLVTSSSLSFESLMFGQINFSVSGIRTRGESNKITERQVCQLCQNHCPYNIFANEKLIIFGDWLKIMTKKFQLLQ